MTTKKINKKRSPYQKLITCLGGIIVILGIFQVAVFVFFSSQSQELTEIAKKAQDLTTKRAQLNQELINQTSFSTLQNKATRLGFITVSRQKNVMPPKVIYLTRNNPIAAKTQSR